MTDASIGTPDSSSSNPLVSAEDQTLGLTTAEAEKGRAQYGFNELPSPELSFFKKLFPCLKSDNDTLNELLRDERKGMNDTMSNTAIAVKRNGKFETMQSRYIVPGDVITVFPGLVVRTFLPMLSLLCFDLF